MPHKRKQPSMTQQQQQQQMRQSSRQRHQRPPAGDSLSSADVDDGGGLHPRRAFRVLGSPDFSEAEPSTALEYLRRVKWEAKRQPRAWTAVIDPQRLLQLQPPQPTVRDHGRALDRLPPTSPLALPSSDWQSHFASHFTDMRLALLRYTDTHMAGSQSRRVAASDEPQSLPPRVPLPSPRDYPAWLRFCLGGDFDVERCIRAEAGEGKGGREQPTPQLQCPSPELQVVVGWDQLSTRAIVHRLVDHLHRCHERLLSLTPHPQQQQRQPGEAAHTHTLASTMAAQHDSDEEEADGEENDGGETEPELSPTSPSTPLAQQQSTATGFMPHLLDLPRASHTVWLYAALLHLEKPLPADVGVQLRQLYRTCGSIRAQAGTALEQGNQRKLRSAGVAEAESKMSSAAAEAAEADEASALECAMRCNLLMTIVDRVFGQRVDLHDWTPP